MFVKQAGFAWRENRGCLRRWKLVLSWRRCHTVTDRGEADRARSIVLTLDGWTAGRIAGAFGVREDTLRQWRRDFMRGGTDALRARKAPGPVPVKTEAAPRVAGALLNRPAADRTNWTLARLVKEVERQEGHSISRAQLSKALKKRLCLQAPAPHVEGAAGREGGDRSGLRLGLLKQQAKAGDIVLLFADESGALTHPYPARAWARRGADLRIPAPRQSKKVAMMGALDYAARHLSLTTSRTKRSSDFIDLLAGLDRQYGPRPGHEGQPAVLVLDNGPVHASKAASQALDERKHWPTVEWLPKYAPELHGIEPVWKSLKGTELAHRTFADTDDLDRAIHNGVENWNSERSPNSWTKPRISA